jgi:hypothetical protein
VVLDGDVYTSLPLVLWLLVAVPLLVVLLLLEVLPQLLL